LRRRVEDIADILSPSLRADIELTVKIPEELWPVSVDLAEFDLALINIAVNARDAMPDGGAFRVEAANVALAAGDPASEGLAGDFVAITLSDTGAGMAPEVQAQAFEPYFTTKEIGLGSGLGLSQVYGFANQSGGAASIASRVSKGTSITLFLPRAAEQPTAAATELDAVPLTTAGRILVVEDEAEVARVTMETLREIGYQTVEARDGRTALAVIEQDPTIVLVLSDVAMPGGISGLDLARKLRNDRPGLPVVLVTGYAQRGSRVADEHFTFLAKPYHRNALATAIGNALARADARRQTAVAEAGKDDRDLIG
jgi:two-component system, NtrC family, sensor kinase